MVQQSHVLNFQVAWQRRGWVGLRFKVDGHRGEIEIRADKASFVPVARIMRSLLFRHNRICEDFHIMGYYKRLLLTRIRGEQYLLEVRGPRFDVSEVWPGVYDADNGTEYDKEHMHHYDIDLEKECAFNAWDSGDWVDRPRDYYPAVYVSRRVERLPTLHTMFNGLQHFWCNEYQQDMHCDYHLWRQTKPWELTALDFSSLPALWDSLRQWELEYA